MNRREFLFLGAAGLFVGCREFGAASDAKPVVRFGMVTDLHYADIDPDPAPVGVVGRRYYRESLRKLNEAVDVFNARGLDFAIELGDFKDLTKDVPNTLVHLEAIEGGFARFKGPRYHVAGNHDFDCLSSEEFFSRTPNDGTVTPKGYYSFVRGGITFVVLNACYNSALKPYDRKNTWDDANVPPEELAWLEGELAKAKGPVIVFCHQRLENSAEPRHIVRNASAVRAVLEQSGKVKGVITGHQHKGGANVVNGIPYYSLRALVCDSGEGNNSFAEVAVSADGTFMVTGWRNAVSRGAKGEFPARGVIAHRGDAAEFPENTVPALKAAVAKGAEMVEIDEWRCRTGELVVMHDPKVDRTTNGKGKLWDLTLAEIKALDAGSKKGAQFAGEKVPTLEEALACFPKTGLVLTTDAGWSKPWTEEEAWRKLRDAAKLGVEFVQILPNCHCTQEQMVFLHDLGIRTAYFFANDPAKMRELVAEGHDFIFTDFYSKLRSTYDQAQEIHA